MPKAKLRLLSKTPNDYEDTQTVAPKFAPPGSAQGKSKPKLAEAEKPELADAEKKVSGELYLSALRLTDFRNYSSLSLDLDHRPVVLSGANGAGKTNLLEAVSLLAPGRGLRRAAFSDLANAAGSGLWAVAGTLQHGQDVVKIGTGLVPPQSKAGKAGRVVKIDGQVQKSPTALGRFVNIVWLTPAIDGLFTGAASDRRRFFDRLIPGVDSGYRTSLSRFERAMRQRNKLLELGGAPSHFEALEAQMAEAATAVSAARLDAVQRLEAMVAAKWRGRNDAAFPWIMLDAKGSIERDLAQMPAVEAEDAYRARLNAGRPQDQAARRTLDGPHRTDFVAVHGPKNMPARLSSTGEQKALLIGLILAHAALIRALNGGAPPLILLDEIAAHLDETRRTALFEDILCQGVQAFMTGTDASVFAPFSSGAQHLVLADGVMK